MQKPKSKAMAKANAEQIVKEIVTQVTETEMEVETVIETQPMQEIVNKAIIAEKSKSSARQVVDKEMLVTIMNNTTGRVPYTSKKTGQSWTFYEYGQTDEMTLAELITMNNAYPRYLKEPWILLCGENAEIAITTLGLEDVYKRILKPSEINAFLKLHTNQFTEVLKNMPKGMQSLVINLIREKYINGEFDSSSKLQAIKNEFGVDLVLELTDEE